MPPALKPFAVAVQAISRRLVGQRTASKADLTRIRSAMLERVLDCELKTVRRIRVQLAGASSAVQLWLLRSEVYQAVSEQFGQAEAAARIESLEPDKPGQCVDVPESASTELVVIAESLNDYLRRNDSFVQFEGDNVAVLLQFVYGALVFIFKNFLFNFACLEYQIRQLVHFLERQLH